MVFTSPPSMRIACKQSAEYGDNFKDYLHKSTFHEVACTRQGRQTVSRMFSTSPPSMRMASMRQGKPTLSRTIFTSPPTVRNACKQFAEFGDSFKDCLHNPPSRRVACMQLAALSDNFKDCLHKPTLHKDGLHTPMEADTLKDGLHKPTFHEDGLQAIGRVRRQFQVSSSQAHLP